MRRSVYAVTGASGHLGRLAAQELLTRGDLETDSRDLEQLLERPATSLADVIGGETHHRHA